jgi:hypothetical protein
MPRGDDEHTEGEQRKKHDEGFLWYTSRNESLTKITIESRIHNNYSHYSTVLRFLAAVTGDLREGDRC